MALPSNPDENDLRLSNLVTPYGVGTRSYNRSAEKREMDRQRKEVTEKYLAARRLAVELSGNKVYRCAECGVEFVVYGATFESETRTCGKQQCIRANAVRTGAPLPLLCTCAQRSYPHELSVHGKLRGESWNRERHWKWPWSLCLSEKEELSAGRTVSR